jgi:hypothetical protein
MIISSGCLKSRDAGKTAARGVFARLLLGSALWLERITTGWMAAVVSALVWIVVVAKQPGWLRRPSPVVELRLLVTELLLVSVVAMLHTRS